jgi:hypothetical protein
VLSLRSLAQIVDAKVACNRVKPSGKPGRPAKVGGVLYHPHEGVLDDLLGGTGAREVPQREVVEWRLMPPDEQRKRRTVAVLEARHQSFVAGVAAVF